MWSFGALLYELLLDQTHPPLDRAAALKLIEPTWRDPEKKPKLFFETYFPVIYKENKQVQAHMPLFFNIKELIKQCCVFEMDENYGRIQSMEIVRQQFAIALAKDQKDIELNADFIYPKKEEISAEQILAETPEVNEGKQEIN